MFFSISIEAAKDHPTISLKLKRGAAEEENMSAREWERKARKHEARARRAEKRAASREPGHPIRKADEQAAQIERMLAADARVMAKASK